MAIIIPSKNIYDNQNPKIRDNVIERIEVGAVEVVPDNEYETTVYNGTFENIFSIGVNQNDTEIKVDGYGYIAYISYVEAIPQYGNIENLDVAILKNNHYIEKLLLGKDKNENPNINISFIGNIYKGKATQQRTSSTSSGTNIQEVVYQEPTYKENGVRYELPELTISNTVDSGNGLYVATASLNVNNETNLVNLTAKKITIQNIEYFRIENLKVLCGLKFAKIGKILSFTNPDNFGTYTLEGEYEEYIPTQIEITIYGNTIGIDLTDKTVYINGETAKKVHSVDGNELMQTTNYYVIYENPIFVTVGGELGSSADTAYYELFGEDLSVGQILHYNNEEAEITELPEETGDAYRLRIKPNGEWAKATTKTITVYLYKTIKNAINQNYSKTKIDYTNGKETATIRCSISDYYDYEDNSLTINSNKKNILTYPYLFGKKQTLYGITATDLGNGSISLKGKSTLGDYIFFNLMNKKIEGINDNTFVATSANNPFTKYGYTISMGQFPNSEYNGIAIGYTVQNNLTWVRIDPYKEINIIIYPMINKGGEIPFESPVTPMCFSIGDEVIPMVYGVDGKDYPMSTYQNGTAKVFQVLGTKIYYDGAVWQELSLQELTKAT